MPATTANPNDNPLMIQRLERRSLGLERWERQFLVKVKGFGFSCIYVKQGIILF